MSTPQLIFRDMGADGVEIHRRTINMSDFSIDEDDGSFRNTAPIDFTTKHHTVGPIKVELWMGPVMALSAIVDMEVTYE